MWMTNNGIIGIMPTNLLKLDFAYDFMGRRVQKIVSTWGSTNFVAQSTNRFIYDGWNLLAVVNPQSSILQSFVWGKDLSGTMTKAGGVGGLLMASISGTNCFAAYDGNGNITALINAADKSLAARYEYSPYGELLRETGLIARQNPFRFSTKFWDEESGLVFYNYRFYSPCLGRWISKDPSQEKGGKNLFAFCKNNSLTKIDMDGQIMIEPEADLWLNEMVNYLEMEAKAQALGLTEEAGTARFLANFASKNAMRAILAEGGEAAAGEAGFASTEVMGALGATAIGGLVVGVGAGLLFVYAVDQAAEGFNAEMDVMIKANEAIIDWWADPNTF
jgi:RHS repeat-associated protein